MSEGRVRFLSVLEKRRKGLEGAVRRPSEDLNGAAEGGNGSKKGDREQIEFGIPSMMPQSENVFEALDQFLLLAANTK